MLSIQKESNILDISHTPSTKNKSLLSFSQSDTSLSNIPYKYLSRRLAQRSNSRPHTISRNQSFIHSNSQPTFLQQFKTPSRATLLNNCNSMINYPIAPNESKTQFSTLSKSELEESIKAQLGLNYILIDLNSCCKSDSSMLGRAKYELVQDLKSNKKMAFLVGVSEKQLSRKIEEIQKRVLQENKTQLELYQEVINQQKSDLDQLKYQMENYLNQTLKITENFCTNQSNRLSSASLHELELAFSSQTSQSRTLEKASNIETSIQTFGMDSMPELDSQILDQIQNVRNFVSKESYKEEEEPKLSPEEKLMLMIQKNKEALNQRSLLYNDQLVEINESQDDVMPKTKPPQSSLVILESFIKQSIKSNQKHIKQIFEVKSNNFGGRNLKSVQQFPSTRAQTQENEMLLGEQTEVCCDTNRISEMSDQSDVLSQLGEEQPMAEFVVEMRKVKQNKREIV